MSPEDEVIKLVQIRRMLTTGQARALRESAGLSCAEVAWACDTDAASVSRWERGEVTPGRGAALRLGAFLERLAAQLDELSA